MNLPEDLISLFVKNTNDAKNKQTESTVYGTIVERDKFKYVRIDGSDLLTPVITTTDMASGERVSVLIKNHSATVMGNISSPAAKNTTVKEIDKKVDLMSLEKISATELEAEIAKLGYLSANSGEFIELKSEVADLDELIFGSAGGTTIQTEFSNSVVSQIGNAQILSAMIKDLDVAKLNSGTISTTKFTLASDDGGVVLFDNTLQMSDGERVRIQMGKDLNGDYSITIVDKDGNIQWSEGGITENAITEAIIRDDMVSETANINAAKLNISSLFDVINEDGSNTLKSSKIYLDEKSQTLDVAFTSMTNNITSATAIANSALASATEADSKIDNLAIGGVNLAKGTSTGAGWSGYTSFDEETRTFTLDNTVTGERTFKSSEFTIKEGETYTLSFKAKRSNESRTMDVYFINSHYISEETTLTLTSFQQLKPPVDEFEYYTYTFTAKYGSEHIYLRFDNNQNTSVTAMTIYIKDVKLEKGNIATDYTYAPEDIESVIENVQDIVTSQGTQLSVIQGQIGAKIWEMDIDQAKATNSKAGSSVLITDGADGNVIYFGDGGKSTQDGIPTLDTPIDIVSVGDSGYFDGELLQGNYGSGTGVFSSSSIYVCNKNAIPCEANDNIKLIYESDVKGALYLLYYDKDMNYLSFDYVTSVDNLDGSLSSTAPNNAYYFNFNVGLSTGITPSTAEKIVVTINGMYALIVKSRYKNQLENFSLKSVTTKNSVTCTPNEDGSFTLNGTSTAYTLFNINYTAGKTLPNGTYKILGGKSTSLMIQATVGSSVVAQDKGSGATFTIDESVKNNWIRIYVAANTTFNNETIYPIVMPVNVEDETFKKYKEPHTVYIPIKEPLRSIGNVKDEITCIDGVYGVIRRIAETQFDGSETWSDTTQVNDVYRRGILVADMKMRYNGAICTHFKTSDAANFSTINEVCFATHPTQQRMFFFTEFETSDEWVAWLQANPIKVVYELAEEEIEELDQTPFKDIKTFNPITYITASNDAEMEIEYYRNSEDGQRLAAANGVLGYDITDLAAKYVDVNMTIDGIETIVGGHTTNITVLGSRVGSVETKYTQLDNKFSWIVESGTSATDFTITDRMIEATTEKFVIKSSDGSSTIISGGKMNIDEIFTQDITATGTITGAKLRGGTITGAKLSGGTITGSIFKGSKIQGLGNGLSFEMFEDGIGMGGIETGNTYEMVGMMLRSELDDTYYLDFGPLKRIDGSGNETMYAGIMGVSRALLLASYNDVEIVVDAEDPYKLTERFNNIESVLGSLAEQNINYFKMGNYAVQWGTITLGTRDSSKMVYGIASFPVSFDNTSYTIIATSRISVSNSIYFDTEVSTAAKTTSSVHVRAYSPSGAFTTDNFPTKTFEVDWVAIGRIA